MFVYKYLLNDAAKFNTAFENVHQKVMRVYEKRSNG